MSMNFWIRSALLALVSLPLATAAASLNPRFTEAERLYREGSYQQAHGEYEKLADDLGNPEDRRWVQFRLAETLARAEATTSNADDSTARTAEIALREFIADQQAVDRIWAETHEALGDISWFGRNRYAWHESWPHYEKALDFWAGSTNLTYAAERYWSIIRKAAQPPRVQSHYF